MAKLGYVKIPGVVNLSYSKVLTLHSCPRKFELQEIEEYGQRSESIPTAYGHAWMAGVQELFNSGSIERAYVAAYSYWPFDFGINGDKYKRSIGLCLHSLETFYHGAFQELVAEWELIPQQGIEHLFLIQISEGFNYQGHIDLILRHRATNRIAVFEGKTTTMEVSEATYANSAQTGGYQVVLNYMAHKYGYVNEGEIYYLVQRPQDVLNYEAGFGFQIMPFHKGYKAAVEFVQSMLSEIERIQHYQRTGHFPKYGESCRNFGRNCHYFGLCNLDDLSSFFMTKEAYESLDLTEVNTVIDMDTLVQQISELTPNEELHHGP